MKIKHRERTAILQSLAAGVVPKIGLQHIQVGRKNELQALITDLMNIEDGCSSIRFVIGRFGSGKSFFLNLVRTVAIERKFVILQADITVDRRLYGSGGSARALYTELIKNMSTRAKPEGGALSGLIEKFVLDIHNELNGTKDFDKLENAVKTRLQPLLDLTHGMNLIRVLAKYVEGFSTSNDDLMNAATRWLRGEYGTKTEARQDLDVRDIIEDEHFYDMLKLWAKFIKLAGYSGLFVNLDELVVLSERLNNSAARAKNYEMILHILNDCLQGHVEGLGFCFAGTEDFLSDRKRGLFSYEALATRLADNPFSIEGTVDTKGPVIRLEPLSREDLFVLLGRIVNVHSNEFPEKTIINEDGILRFMNHCEKRLGAEYFLTPRDAVQQFVGLLNVMEQNPDKDISYFIKDENKKIIFKIDESTDCKPGNDELVDFKL
ncbi:MAG: ATP-binding protein [Planctomycetes bacterium GWF2_41_51]|nr:MAG: ATP-binding protein [Planctomycetes bacterium GWF2_41_51]HBG25601.1 ATP-binding protein [Phycisphaerales bacterium]